MSDSVPLDLPTASALVRLRLLGEDARRRTADTTEAGRHLALVALDGACEYALWLVSREHTIPVKERAGLPDLYSAVKEALPGWQVRGWRGVSQMHQARNVAQHAGVAPDANQLPNWLDATTAFLDSLCVAAFGTELADIVLAGAVRDQSLRTQLRWSEDQLAESPGRSFALAVGAFDEARKGWRAQRNTRVFAPSPAGDPPSSELGPPLQDVDEFLEVQPFAGDFGEYTWLRRARQEHEQAGWLPDEHEARRALLFIAGWIVRWEIFNQGYTPDRWEAHREAIQPPTTGDGTTTEIVDGQVEFLSDVPGRPARNLIYLTVANVPGRGRSPWDTALRDAITESATAAGASGVFLDLQWYLSGTLLAQVPVDAEPQVVGDALERGIALAAERHARHLDESAKREEDRQRLETALSAVIAATQAADISLFGTATVVDDQWLGTFGWLAFVQIHVSSRGQEELTQTCDIFGNQHAAFPNLHVRDGQVAFSINELNEELHDALRTAIVDSEEQTRHVRAFRKAQAQRFQAFAGDLHLRFKPPTDP